MNKVNKIHHTYFDKMEFELGYSTWEVYNFFLARMNNMEAHQPLSDAKTVLKNVSTYIDQRRHHWLIITYADFIEKSNL